MPRVLISALVAAALFAQSRRTGSPPKPAEPNLLYLDATAETPEGQPIRNLAAADLTIAEGGEIKKLNRLTFIDTAIAPSVLLFVVDDLSLTSEAAGNLRTALHRYVDSQFRPTDRVAILCASGGSDAGRGLTSDQRLLRAAIDGIYKGPGDIPADALTAGPKVALRVALSGLENEPGRKAAVIFTANRALLERPLATPATADQFAAVAHRVAAVVSVVDLSGSTAGPHPDSIAQLVTRTGGRVVTGDPATALDTVLHVHQGYYLLAYESDANLFSGRFQARHPVVTVARQGVVFRAREGVVDRSILFDAGEHPSLYRPAGAAPAADLARAINSPFASAAWPVKVAATHAFGKSGPLLDIRVLPDGADLVFTHTLKGRWTAAIDFEITILYADGELLVNGTRHYSVELDQKDFERTRAVGVGAEETFPLRRAGGYYVRVAARDATSGMVGSASTFVYAPAFAKGDLLITGLHLKPQQGPSVGHVFKRGETFSYEYQIAGLTTDETKRSAMESRCDILHDSQTLFEGRKSLVSFSPSDTEVRTATASVKLGESMAPGRYILRLSLSDKLAPERTATHAVEFEVR